MTDLINLNVRARREFVTHLDWHLREIGWPGSRADYILTALTDKMSSELDEPLPVPKAPHGVRKDARPAGWKSRLYADRYEIMVRADGTLSHLHETGEEFPHFRKSFSMDLDGVHELATVYIHTAHRAETHSSHSPYFEDSPMGYRVREFIRQQRLFKEAEE